MKKLFILSVIFLFLGTGFTENSDVSLISNSTIFRTISESQTEFFVSRTDSNSIDSISLSIDLYRDTEAQRHSAVFLLEGDKTTNNERFNIGLEWNAPVSFFRNTTRLGEIGYEAAAISLGFVAKNTNEEFPFLFSAGPVFEGGVNRNLQGRDTIFGGGGYFRLLAGESEFYSASRIGSSPFLFGGQVFGRYIGAQDNHYNTNAHSTFIYQRNGIFGADTFSITVNDTIGYGKISSQFNTVGGFRGNEIPSRYSNNLSITIHAGQLGDGFIRPSFEVFLNDNRHRYVSSEFFYGSLRRNTISVLGFLNESFGGWNLETGLQIAGTREENSYFSSTRGSSAGTLLDTLNEKLKNADIFHPRVYFSAEYLSPNENFGLTMRYSTERNRRIYPFSFVYEGETFSSVDDIDNISNIGFVQTAFYFTDWYNLYLSAEMLRYRVNFLKSEMSNANRTEERFALGIENVFSRDTTLIFGLRGNAVAAPQRFYFMQSDNSSLPSHNRSFSVSSDLTLAYSNGWSNIFEFMTSRFDRGVIYNEVMYGLEEKRYETVSSATLARTLSFLHAASGIEARIMNAYRFDHDEGDYLSRGRWFLFSPFASLSFFSDDKFSLNLYAKRNINRGQTNSTDFWDLSLNVFAFF
ncbi:MAG: hypothetical protein FWE23_10845 [Chitinivibrionia bacterium]|nr:hypothetical protein [Chitinivibrionia bacterium]